MLTSLPSRALRPSEARLNFCLWMQIIQDALLANLVWAASLDPLFHRKASFVGGHLHGGTAGGGVEHALFDLGARGAGVDEDYGGGGGAVMGVREAIEGVAG